VDLHERRELDMSAQVARVRAKARPWRSIIALVLALCGLAAGEYGRFGRHLDDATKAALSYGGGAVFLLFGLIAVFGLSGQARNLLQPAIGAAHAGVTRYAFVLVGIFTVLVVSLNILSLPVGQLVLGGAVTGVLLGIAAQQSLANLFAGMVLLFARPFRVGDRVRFRAGALSGTLEGTVTDISITYVRLETDDGLVFVPNSQALAATVGPIAHPQSDAAGVAPGSAAGAGGTAGVPGVPGTAGTLGTAGAAGLAGTAVGAAGAAAGAQAAAAGAGGGAAGYGPGMTLAGTDASLAAVAGAAAASAVAAILGDAAAQGAPEGAAAAAQGVSSSPGAGGPGTSGPGTSGSGTGGSGTGGPGTGGPGTGGLGPAGGLSPSAGGLGPSAGVPEQGRGPDQDGAAANGASAPGQAVHGGSSGPDGAVGRDSRPTP
jgi:hypothetical protein